MQKNMTTNDIHIFTDGSFDPKSKQGVACFLLLNHEPIDPPNKESVENLIKCKVVEDTTCSRLELQSLLLAILELNTRKKINQKIIIYTDSETIANLTKKRIKLESKNFCNSKGLPLHNGDLYKQFFHLYDNHDIQVHWVSGHKRFSDRNTIDHWFALIDQHARQFLRNNILS